MKPVAATINLVGSKDTHPQLSEIIQSGLQQHICKKDKVDANYAAPLYNI